MNIKIEVCNSSNNNSFFSTFVFRAQALCFHLFGTILGDKRNVLWDLCMEVVNAKEISHELII